MTRDPIGLTVIHVQTRGGEVIASGRVVLSSDDLATYATLVIDEPISGRGADQTEAMLKLARNLEAVATRIRWKATP